MNSEFLAQARAYKNELIARLFGQPESSPTETEKLSILQAIPEGSNIVGVGFGVAMSAITLRYQRRAERRA